MITPLSRFVVGDTVVQFDSEDGKGPIQVTLRPKALRPGKQREFLPDTVDIRGLPKSWRPVRARVTDSVVHLKSTRDDQVNAFAAGRTMLAGPGTTALRFVRQSVVRKAARTTVVTRFKHPTGLAVEHHFSWEGNDPVFSSRTVVRNAGKEPVSLELLTSFSLGGLTPFAEDDAPDRLTVHRFRSAWSAEGRLESRRIEDLQLERSWFGHGVASERFGQLGSMPVNGFFPFVALEDRAAGVVWGAQLACASSWQMEIYRRDDSVCLSGGLADREFGHWMKTLAPGAMFETPVATLACLQGGLDALCQRLVSAQARSLDHLPPVEDDLPIVMNEWCTSWGAPTHENLLALAKKLQGTPVRYVVIDDGWAERPGDGIQQNGDWKINRVAFPGGLRATCEAIRERGLVPGIWFEFEVCNEGSRAFSLTDHHLHRDGRALRVGSRRFWDFRDPFTFDYLTRKVIDLLRDNAFGYLKVDYNDTIGVGCDGAESLGEGLRVHIAGVQEFFRSIQRALPDLVIENCSSGGHRLEPSMMALCAMGSSSDAHETPEIPIIAASLQRLILARQSQIWAVLRRADSPRRIAYSLAATFLGRMCLSGEVHELTPAQWKLAVSGMELYRRVFRIIRDGVSTFHGEVGASWRHAKGWQAVVRTATRGGRALVVAHSFGRPVPKSADVPLDGGKWEIVESWPAEAKVALDRAGCNLRLQFDGEFQGFVVVLRRKR